jgi:hypothetical protein
MGIFTPTQVSTQEHLDIEDIRDDCVILKSGSVAVVIETSAVNFELLSSGEQDASIYTFANLLNSINFPIQIVLRTVITDISNYIEKLEGYRQTVSGTPLGSQVALYQDFISNLTENTNILDKRFYIVVPTMAFEIVKTSFIRQIFGQKKRIINVSSILKQARTELEPKRDHILKQLENMNLQARQLKTDELIKLYYGVYDPDKQGGSKLSITNEDITSGIVNSS